MDKKTTQITGILIVIMLTCASIVAIITLSPQDKGTYTYKLNTFSTYDELLAFLHKRFETYENQSSYYDGRMNVMFDKSESTNGGTQSGDELPSYSTTNVQVAGVDEPDIVKTDGTYLYMVANQTVFIIKAYPPLDAIILSRIKITNVTISNIFIRGDHLVIFGDSGGYYGYPLLREDVKVAGDSASIWWGGEAQTVINIYDISDRSNPVLSKDIKIDGSYFDARLIDEYVYVVASEYTNNIYRALDEQNYTLNVPEIIIDDENITIPPSDIYYVDLPELSDTMTHVVSINLDTIDIDEKSFMLGSSQTMYVSKNNIFLTSTHYQNYPVLYGVKSESTTNSNQETTILHKISINTGDVTYIAQGEVPGQILNQFSMDEHNGFFRVATTVGNNWGEESQTSNNIYILDENLKQISKIENIAPGESIYAARFLGDRAYLVTFVQVDPLFTVDLSDPYNPKILGELKIPGYSEYLHPYDETHIIGIGKEVDPTIDADKIHTPGAIYYTAILGLKIALFDVSDFENPKEVAKVVIGDRGTDSPALYDHKAFLFDKEKELLVIPVSLYEISQEVKDQYIASNGTETLTGEFTFQGAYVYRLTLDNGFEFKGRITHQTPEEMQKQTIDYYWYWGSSSTDITRTLYIGETLYTISDSMVKMNSLNDLSEINSINLE
jgi:uncharacterized secreted protein with C-terminal beta-propeller domain